MNRNIILCCAALLIGTSACSSRASDSLNPFIEKNGADQLGVRNNKALLSEGGGGNAEGTARLALQQMGTYRRAQTPQPAYPAVQPAEVRLMWIPDHLNKHGDLVPQHYYYLKVLSDRWALQDAFDIEQQLDEGSKSSGPGSATPWVYKKR